MSPSVLWICKEFMEERVLKMPSDFNSIAGLVRMVERIKG